MPDSLTILHISDMQFGKFHRFTQKHGDLPNEHDSLITRLIDDLEFLEDQEQLRPDLILCTGDLAEWGLRDEFKEAFAFLARLCEHYALPRNRCIVVPGNHDINRAACKAYFYTCEAESEPLAFPWFPKWKQYKEAFDTFYVGFPDIRFEPERPYSLFRDEDLGVVVAGLNSTIDEGHDEAVQTLADSGHHGLCTEGQLRWFDEQLKLPQFTGWLRIGAVHHNAIRGVRSDEENLRDADLLSGILGGSLHFLLHGHTHEAKSGFLASGLPVYSTGSASLTTSGAASPVPTDIPNQYQILRIDRESITRYCRQYAPRNTPPRFIADTRQSRNGSDWIIRENVNLRSVTAFTDSAAAAADTPEESTRPTETTTAATRLPTPPTFYAQPDYIGSHKFVGRAAELQLLSDWAAPADPTNLLLFEAIGGNGKSMLTWEWTTNHALAARPADSPWAGRFWYSFYERGAIMADFCRHALAYMTGKPLEEFAKQKTAELTKELLVQLHAHP